MLSIIVPTRNERENVETLIPDVADLLAREGIDGEILVIDDASPDGTAAAASALSETCPVRVVVREQQRGLAGAVIRGFEESRGDILAVMDADHSHAPEHLAVMYAAIMRGSHLVVGSRHVAGGGMEGWPLHRRLVSKGAALLAAGLTSVKDPTSGFFMLRRAVVDGVRLTPLGFKIGLEILVKGRHEGRVEEVPIRFADRRHGTSKLTNAVVVQYVRHLVSLYLYRLRQLTRRS